MRRLILKRTASGLLLLLAASLLCFLLLHLAPGNFLDRLRLDPGIPASTLETLGRRYGLERSWYAQYASWLAGVVAGDLGFSLAFQRPVSDLLVEASGRTLLLAAVAEAAAFALGLPLALLALLRPRGLVDRALSVLAFILISIPTLVVAVLSLGIAARTGGVVPVGGGSRAGLEAAGVLVSTADLARHLLLPALVLTLALAPALYLQARGALEEALASPFVLAARARGLAERHILWRHALRVALVPVLTHAGSSVGRLLSAAFLVEVVIGWPGLGRLAWTALLARDTLLFLAILVLGAGLLIAGNLGADLLAAAADPRIRLEEELSH